MNFKEQYINGRIKFNDILEFIDAWHKNQEGKDLSEFLGLNKEEMQLLAYGDDQLKIELDKIKSHKLTGSKKNLVKALSKIIT